MIVDSNAPAPLKYTDPTFTAGPLFIRANIYDTSGVSPSLESTVNLTLIDNGTYWAKYTFTAAKTYLVQKLVYTDGTYSTVDQTYAQDNDDVQCVDLQAGGGGGGTQFIQSQSAMQLNTTDLSMEVVVDPQLIP